MMALEAKLGSVAFEVELDSVVLEVFEAKLDSVVGGAEPLLELVPLHIQLLFLSAFDELEANVSSDDLLHLSYLQAACRAENNTVLPLLPAPSAARFNEVHTLVQHCTMNATQDSWTSSVNAPKWTSTCWHWGEEEHHVLEPRPHTPMLFLSPEHVFKLTKHTAWLATEPAYLLAPGLGADAHPDGWTRSVLELADTNRCRQNTEP
ncbi:NPP1 protein [Phytophthora cinnamomi]|uniref:NPP1 protein n=1 Tax=Phytophthora cinnamomi TaxID=4785 RepID=UPI003559DFF0|nr:NPP1 protein [Phytophthora cinnamomi]